MLRAARLEEGEWLLRLPRIGPAGRALLRGRKGLPAGVVRGLEAFGATDFTLTHDAPEPVHAPEPPRERPNGGMFAIAELVERIETFHRHQEERPCRGHPRPSASASRPTRPAPSPGSKAFRAPESSGSA